MKFLPHPFFQCAIKILSVTNIKLALSTLWLSNDFRDCLEVMLLDIFWKSDTIRGFKKWSSYRLKLFKTQSNQLIWWNMLCLQLTSNSNKFWSNWEKKQKMCKMTCQVNFSAKNVQRIYLWLLQGLKKQTVQNLLSEVK